MQGTYFLLDLNKNSLIKRRRFTKLPIPNSAIWKLEQWGKNDKQDWLIHFCDHKNYQFEWTDEQEPLVQDNAPCLELALFPDNPAHMPGIMLESNAPAIETLAPPTKEEPLAATMENALFTVEFAEFRFQGWGNVTQSQQPQNLHITHNHLHIVPAMEWEINEPIESNDEHVANESRHSWPARKQLLQWRRNICQQGAEGYNNDEEVEADDGSSSNVIWQTRSGQKEKMPEDTGT